MSSRKRPLAEIAQPNTTPFRYAPSTPHAIRALQQRSGAKTRSARSARHITADTVRPDSIRGVLRQFAKISAPLTKKRVVTPGSVVANKENQNPDEGGDDNDSILLEKPHLPFSIEESLEEDDSELPVPPTPFVLPEDENYDQPTITFQNVAQIPLTRPATERSDRRRSRMSLMHSEPASGEHLREEDDMTIMTERGRRALSEEATGRFSRYSFGTIRMSDFGSELEIGRDSDRYEKTFGIDLDDHVPINGDDSMNDDITENLRGLRRSLSAERGDDTVQLSPLGNETFKLDLPLTEEEVANARDARKSLLQRADALIVRPNTEDHEGGAGESNDTEELPNDADDDHDARQHTMLETATTKANSSRRKRMKLTRHGTAVPSLPTSVVKRIILDSYEKQSKRKPKLGRDHMKALEQATEWYFEQVGEDLAAYSTHGRRRKRIDVDDVLLLMKRQKVLAHDQELQTLARSWLTKDILSGLDLDNAV